MAKEIVTEDFAWEFQIGSGQVSIVGIDGVSRYNKIEGKAILLEPARFSISGYTGGRIDVPMSGTLPNPASLQATALYTKSEGEKVLLDRDKVSVVLQGQNSDNGPVTQHDVLTLRSKQTLVKGS